MRGAIFLSLFGLALVGALSNPFWGLLAYLGHYYVWPERQWWGQLLESAGLRVSLTISTVTIASTALHWTKISSKTPGPRFHPQQALLVAFVAFMGLTLLYGVEPDPMYAEGEPFTKMWKVALFLFVLTQVVTSLGDYQRLLTFVFAVGGVYLGWEARHAPAGSFYDGRLNSLGGPDFSTANFISAHFVVMGILGAALLAKAKTIRARLAILAGGGLVANGFMLARSRGGFLAVAAAAAAGIVLAERRLRRKMLILLPIVGVGCFLLMDKSFVERITTITADESERDRSAQSRVDVWGGALRMWSDHPLGVGCGSFSSVIGNYLPTHAGRDPHSTYMRGLAELGVVGIGLFALLNLRAFIILRNCRRLAVEIGRLDVCFDVLANQLILVAYAVVGLTGTFLYNEGYYIYLMLPVCLERSLLNARAAQGGIDE